MADMTLNNMATATGSYNGVSTGMDSEAVATLIVNGLSITKEADMEIWVTGNLTYTITITNEASYPYEDPVITDTLDITLVSLVEGSVMVDGVATTDYTYDAATGLLTVNLATIPVSGSSVVTFQVQQV